MFTNLQNNQINIFFVKKKYLFRSLESRETTCQSSNREELSKKIDASFFDTINDTSSFENHKKQLTKMLDCKIFSVVGEYLDIDGKSSFVIQNIMGKQFNLYLKSDSSLANFLKGRVETFFPKVYKLKDKDVERKHHIRENTKMAIDNAYSNTENKGLTKEDFKQKIDEEIIKLLLETSTIIDGSTADSLLEKYDPILVESFLSNLSTYFFHGESMNNQKQQLIHMRISKQGWGEKIINTALFYYNKDLFTVEENKLDNVMNLVMSKFRSEHF